MQKPPRLSREESGARAYSRGLWAERFAKWLLRAKLYRIIGERVKTRAGEVDIVARKGQTLVIVEVKARGTVGEAAEAVSLHQWQRLSRAAEILLAREPTASLVRFDVVQIVPGHLPRHIRDAWRP